MKDLDLDLNYSEFIDNESNKNVFITETDKKNTNTEPPKWQTELNNFNDLVKDYSRQYAESQKKPTEYKTGKKVKILGMNTLVFVSVSLGLTVAGIITIIYLGKKRQTI